MIENVTGIILAGGKSSRMGKDKAFIMFGGKPLIEIIVDKLSGIFYDLMIVTNKPNLYDKYGIETQTDIKGNCGPLGGIYTGLVYSKNKYSFVIACDMPFINLEFIKYMISLKDNFDVVVPKLKKGYDALFAIYSKNCIMPIYEIIKTGNLRVVNLFNRIRLRELNEEEVARFQDPNILFANINTINDLAKARQVRRDL